MIRLQNIVKRYVIGKRELQVLNRLNLHIGKGEMVAIMGPSGSGKTTLLNVIGCLDKPSSGDYFFEEREVGHLSVGELAKLRAHKIGFVFQSYNLLPRLSALANVELGLRYAGVYDRKIALAALERIGLADRAHHRPTELSGGEQQRVAIARALVKNPPLIIADEPTGNLDSRTGEEIISILTDLHKESNLTLVMVTHELDIARHCQRIIRIRDGEVVAEERV
jgi:putative ABC transport system ATP-binding protein